jgi:hypothetical protein
MTSMLSDYQVLKVKALEQAVIWCREKEPSVFSAAGVAKAAEEFYDFLIGKERQPA